MVFAPIMCFYGTWLEEESFFLAEGNAFSLYFPSVYFWESSADGAGDGCAVLCVGCCMAVRWERVGTGGGARGTAVSREGRAGGLVLLSSLRAIAVVRRGRLLSRLFLSARTHAAIQLLEGRVRYYCILWQKWKCTSVCVF